MGYVSHYPVHSSENLPPFPASIKDGYAINYVNTNPWSQERSIFNVVQVSVAGTAVSLCIYFVFVYFISNFR